MGTGGLGKEGVVALVSVWQDELLCRRISCIFPCCLLSWILGNEDLDSVGLGGTQHLAFLTSSQLTPVLLL